MWTYLKKCLVAGALLVLPAWLAILLLAALVVKMEVIVAPLVAVLPEGLAHSRLVALVSLLLFCVLVGSVMRTLVGRTFRGWFEKKVLERIPGYSTFRSIGRQMADKGGASGFKPALVEIEEALAPGFVIELLPDDQCTVFIPSAPTPAAGTILILKRNRVHPLDVPVATVFHAGSKWGNGAGELLRALPAGTALPCGGRTGAGPAA
jgi:uncharacterized membrane protein